MKAVEVVSSKSDKEIEMGLEVGEETYLDLHHSLTPVPDPLRLPGHKSVAASIAAAQAVLTNTLSPTTHRKKKSPINLNNGVAGDTTSQSENTYYSFNKEIDQILALGIGHVCAWKAVIMIIFLIKAWSELKNQSVLARSTRHSEV